jgi:hypothetical protein
MSETKNDWFYHDDFFFFFVYNYINLVWTFFSNETKIVFLGDYSLNVI